MCSWSLAPWLAQLVSIRLCHSLIVVVVLAVERVSSPGPSIESWSQWSAARGFDEGHKVLFRQGPCLVVSF